jgi:putative transposase
MGVQIIEGVLSSDHIHMFVSVPPHIAISDLMQRAKGRSSYKIQMEFPEIRKRYWGRRFWARGYFCTTSGTSLMTSYFSIFRATLINLPTPVGSCLVPRSHFGIRRLARPWATDFPPFNRRHVFATALTSLNTMSLAVFADRAPFVRTVR